MIRKNGDRFSEKIMLKQLKACSAARGQQHVRRPFFKGPAITSLRLANRSEA
jgi:hypothetical protein